MPMKKKALGLRKPEKEQIQKVKISRRKIVRIRAKSLRFENRQST